MAFRSLKRAGAILAAAVLGLAGCSSDTETEYVEVQGPRVTISGEFVVVRGAQITLTAATANGTDASYVWSSSSDVASVSNGVVTGISAGTAVITATGATTQASGTYNVVVANAPPDLTTIAAKWSGSGHADSGGEPFRHWDADGAVETPCARCHSSTGFTDYLDDPENVFVAQPVGGGIDCAACHSSYATALTSVKFPSTAVVAGLGAEARCMTCHQGMGATTTVDAAILAAGAADDDTVSTLGMQSAHYFAAGATQNAGAVRGGYQYAGKVYDVKFGHVGGLDSCIECHDPHSLAIDTATCAACHTGVTDLASLRAIREKSSSVDYDGDGNVTEGVAAEIQGVQAALLTAVQGYATAQGLTAICYAGTAYPYFFKDTDANGACDATEAAYANRYTQWTNRLVRAVYNYLFLAKDPGAFAHNAKYAIQLGYDSIADLDASSAAGLARDDEGHFHGSGEPARHWDEDGEVSASCAKCHAGSAGFRPFVATGAAPAVPPQNGLDCATCHAGFMPTSADAKLVSVTSVKFPSTIVVAADTADGDDKLMPKSFICITCHSGRESKKTVDDKIAAGTPQFRNVHYAAAGATLLGTEAKVGYEYDGKTYAGRMVHASAGRGIDCSDCHDVAGHTFRPLTVCSGCHGSNIRTDTVDYDGDGNTTEPLAAELDALRALVLAEMQTAAGANPICYSSSVYPYFLVDANDNGTCDVDEATGYASWTAPLAKAAFNYQFATKDHGAWAHNNKYVAQLLIDSIADLGGDVTALHRP